MREDYRRQLTASEEDGKAALDMRAMQAYERQEKGQRWGDLPEPMKAIWRAYVTGNLPPR